MPAGVITSRTATLCSSPDTAGGCHTRPNPVPSPGTMPIYRRAFAYYRPFLGPTILGAFFTVIGIWFGLFRLWPFKFIIDDVLPAAGKPAHGLQIAGYDLSSWSLPAVVAL